jgi:hypothetical protein
MYNVSVCYGGHQIYFALNINILSSVTDCSSVSGIPLRFVSFTPCQFFASIMSEECHAKGSSPTAPPIRGDEKGKHEKEK